MKKRLTHILKMLSLGFTLLAGMTLALPELSASPPPWAPAHGYRAKHHKNKHKYYYYPAQQVYYSPVQRRYYYQNEGAWIAGVRVPPRIILGNRIAIDLGGPVPYVEHPYVIQQYPAPVIILK